MLDSGDRARALESDTSGLQPAFVDGWMDALPPGLAIVEGTEAIGYLANSPAEYDAASTRQRLRLPEFVAPEHREKFAQRLHIGQSLYLDAHVNPPGNPLRIDSTGRSEVSAGSLAEQNARWSRRCVCSLTDSLLESPNYFVRFGSPAGLYW